MIWMLLVAVSYFDHAIVDWNQAISFRSKCTPLTAAFCAPFGAPILSRWRPSRPWFIRCTTRSSMWRWSLHRWISMHRPQSRGTGASKSYAKCRFADSAEDLRCYFPLNRDVCRGPKCRSRVANRFVWWLWHFGPRNTSRRKPNLVSERTEHTLEFIENCIIRKLRGNNSWDSIQIFALISLEIISKGRCGAVEGDSSKKIIHRSTRDITFAPYTLDLRIGAAILP